MAGWVGLISCLLCAVPFFIVGCFEKDSSMPIVFWSGDRTLKDLVTDVAGYNAKMAKLYKNCAGAFVLAGVCCLLSLPVGLLVLLCECTVGFYLAYRKYKKILDEFS